MDERCKPELPSGRNAGSPHLVPGHAWAVSAQDLLKQLRVDPEHGLALAEARRRRKRFGPNCLRRLQSRSAWQVLWAQFHSLMVALLVAAAVTAAAFGEWFEALAVMAVVLINATVGFFTEMRALRSMEALHRLGRVHARVRRAGRERNLRAELLVPGDIALLEAGDMVTADMRILEASRLHADESALTGESVPVSKSPEVIAEDTPLPERTNVLYKGTAITRGSATAVVVATAMETEVGLISSLVEAADEATTPLERRLDQLSRGLILVTLGIAAAVTVSGALAGRELLLMVETGIALAIATIPEGLPIVATAALARGMYRMAQRNVLMTRLSAVETLGATSVIAVDKTGTLTENRMRAVQLQLEDGPVDLTGTPAELVGDHLAAEALTVGALCNNAALSHREGEDEPRAVGDPLEVALLLAAHEHGVGLERLESDWPEVREYSFDSTSKMMATVHERAGGLYAAVKGAPEAVLEASARVRGRSGETDLSDELRAWWLERNEQMARDGLRVLALASRRMASADEEVYTDLTLIGLVGLLDPPRPQAAGAIRQCREAGIRFIMLTGDQAPTALKVARVVGLLAEGDAETRVMDGGDIADLEAAGDERRRQALQATVIARVTPEQKLDIIDLHQRAGAVVAMTGDGVNDAPALTKADIGIAMGRRGTQVAREAADMILRDDRLESIVEAVRLGRAIFANIRRFVVYLLSCNASEVMAVALASLVNAPLPLLPLQILFLNLVTDVFPALALGACEGDPVLMTRPPRRAQEPVLTRSRWAHIAAYGAAITAAVLAALWISIRHLGMAPAQATTVSFLTLAAAQLWHVFNMRDRGSGLLHNDVVRNPWVWGSVMLCCGLLLAAVYLPGLSDVLRTEDPGPRGWALALIMSLVPLVGGQAYLLWAGRSTTKLDRD